MVTKTKNPVLSLNVTSLKDGAYQQAKANDTIRVVARYAINNIVGFPEDIPKESLEQLNEGYLLRWNENNPPVTYAVINDHFITYDEAIHKDCEKRVGKQIVKESDPASNTRSSIKSFNEVVKEVFDGKNGLVARCKTAKKQRNDTEADEVKLTQSINAFMKVWNS